MAEQPLTISMLAGLDVGATGPGLAADDRAKLVATLRDRAREAKALKTSDLGEPLLAFLTESLREPAQKVLGEVWKQRQELRDIAAKKGAERDVAAEVELIEHTLEWKLAPTVKLEVDGVSVHEMTFDVGISLELEGVLLVLKNAHITGIKTGTMTSTLTLAYKGFPLMAPQEKKIDLPGAIDFPRGGIDLSGGTAPRTSAA